MPTLHSIGSGVDPLPSMGTNQSLDIDSQRTGAIVPDSSVVASYPFDINRDMCTAPHREIAGNTVVIGPRAPEHIPAIRCEVRTSRGLCILATSDNVGHDEDPNVRHEWRWPMV